MLRLRTFGGLLPSKGQAKSLCARPIAPRPTRLAMAIHLTAGPHAVAQARPRGRSVSAAPWGSGAKPARSPHEAPPPPARDRVQVRGCATRATTSRTRVAPARSPRRLLLGLRRRRRGRGRAAGRSCARARALAPRRRAAAPGALATGGRGDRADGPQVEPPCHLRRASARAPPAVPGRQGRSTARELEPHL